jgi:glycosyltransferase involved in cell wall biosynthesis
MKLLFFTPCYKKSAVARSTALVTNALIKRGHTIAIIQTESNCELEEELHDFGSTPISWTRQDKIQELVEAGYHCVYEIGDNFHYHEGAIYWLCIRRGTVCLHDFHLGNLFVDWFHNFPKKLRINFVNLFGPDSAVDSFKINTPNHKPEDRTKLANEGVLMARWVCTQASGVLTHSQWGIDRVLNSCPGPVAICGLAYNEIQGSNRAPSFSENGSTFSLLVVGNVNPNKRLTSLIKAIGEDPLLKKMVHLRSVGPILAKTKKELIALAKDNRVQLTIFGKVSDEKLCHKIQESNAMSCLRYPPLEAASASLIEGLLSKKSILVTNTGFYSEIPDGLVYKVDPNNEIKDIQKHLHSIISDPSLAAQNAIKGFEWAKDTFSVENYATELVTLISKSRTTLPMIEAINNLSAILLAWEPKLEPYLNHDLFPNLEIFEGSS